ncbi:MAG: hypothetical protein SGBAC_010755 [Bacillariaceae sp.]
MPEAFAEASTNEQQDAISKICSERQIVTPLRHESSASDDVSWTICMTINSGFYDFFRNWYKHYTLLDLKLDIVLFAEDPIAYDKLSSAEFLNSEYTTVVNATKWAPPVLSTTTRSELRRDSSPMPTQAPSNRTADASPSLSPDESDDVASTPVGSLWHAWNEGIFDATSSKYIELISNRPTRLLQVVCSGRNVLYIDTDTVLKKNPLPVINKNVLDGVDISVAIDIVGYKQYAHTFDFCTGFLAIKAKSETIDFLSEWEKRCHNDGLAENDQIMFNKAYEALLTTSEESITRRITVKGLSNTLFPNGKQYFTLYDESQRDEAILVHANWIVSGANKKLSLMKQGLWDPE